MLCSQAVVKCNAPSAFPSSCLLRRAGCRITLNSDDPPFFGTSLAQEYETCARTFGWDRAQSLEITRTAIAGAFCDEDTRARLLRAVATAEDAPPDPA